jgi:hypothetical protein
MSKIVKVVRSIYSKRIVPINQKKKKNPSEMCGNKLQNSIPFNSRSQGTFGQGLRNGPQKNSKTA